MFGPSSFCFGRKKPTAFRFPPGEESFIFVGSFLPFNRKPTSLGFAVGIRGNESKLHSVSAVSVRAAKTAYSLAHSSFPNRTHFVGLRFGDAG